MGILRRDPSPKSAPALPLTPHTVSSGEKVPAYVMVSPAMIDSATPPRPTLSHPLPPPLPISSPRVWPTQPNLSVNCWPLPAPVMAAAAPKDFGAKANSADLSCSFDSSLQRSLARQHLRSDTLETSPTSSTADETERTFEAADSAAGSASCSLGAADVGSSKNPANAFFRRSFPSVSGGLGEVRGHDAGLSRSRRAGRRGRKQHTIGS
jgi:hypothetical protein